MTSNDHRITVFSGTRVGHSATLACLAGDIRLLNPPPPIPWPVVVVGPVGLGIVARCWGGNIRISSTASDSCLLPTNFARLFLLHGCFRLCSYISFFLLTTISPFFLRCERRVYEMKG